MASAFSHIAVPICLALSQKKEVFPYRLVFFGMVLSIFPDLDVIAFKFGIPYSSPWGHRGFSHSIFFSLVFPLCLLPLATHFRVTQAKFYLMSALSLLSHGLADALTNGGLGIAFFWPFDDTRYFFPFRPIEVSPISIQRFFTSRGLEILYSELIYIWAPCGLVALSCRMVFDPLLRNKFADRVSK